MFNEHIKVKDGLCELYRDDNIHVMSSLKSESVDAIITDPPYNISRDNNFSSMGMRGIDFGEWDKNFNVTSWIEIAEPLLKKGGNIIIFTDWKKITLIVNCLSDKGFEVKDLIRWKKTNAVPRNRDRRFITDYEVAIWAVKKGGKWTFNRLSDTYEIPEIVGGIIKRSEKVNGGHPTQKPIYVMEWLLKRLTNKNDIVLDPFMGSGSTGEACMKNDRNFIGIEIDDGYFEMACSRIATVCKK